MELYGSAKGTVREALKILEVEGLITLKTSLRKAVINQPSSRPASHLLRNPALQQLDGKQVYQLRKLLEVELAASWWVSSTAGLPTVGSQYVSLPAVRVMKRIIDTNVF